MIEWVLLIILLFVIGGSAFFYTRNNDSTPPTPAPTITPTYIPAPTITPTYIPAPTPAPTVNPFHEKWNSILLADRVEIRTTGTLTTTVTSTSNMTTGTTTIGTPQEYTKRSIWVWDNPTPVTNELTKSLAQRPRFHEGIFYGEGVTAIPLRPKGDSLIGIYEGKSLELKILNYLNCEMTFDNMIITCVRLQ
jgi:hypothetical protein